MSTRTGTVACECGWKRRQHWWLPGFSIRKVMQLISEHRAQEHPETLGTPR